LIPSPKVATYDLEPDMSARGITDELLRLLPENEFDVIILNLANPDMVGHTGVFEATIKAVEVVDECLGKIEQAIKQIGGTLLVTADHGNAESEMDLETGLPLTAHTTNKVPFIVVDDRFLGCELRADGALCDVAPTMLELLALAPPQDMTGKSLLIK